jgi:Ni/Fe-hydrogenase subunit HybB-like protein
VLEILITLGIAAIGFSAFTILARYLPIFTPEPQPPQFPNVPWARVSAPEEAD